MNKVTRSFNRKTGRTEVRGNVTPRLQKIMDSNPVGQYRRGIVGGTATARHVPSTPAPVVDDELAQMREQVRAMLAQTAPDDSYLNDLYQSHLTVDQKRKK